MKQILIVEDDREIAELERDYLEASSLQVTIAGDGETGRREALSGKYDLVILDLMLPGCDGFQICRAIREKFLIPVLVVSARQTDIDKIRVFGLGADDYLTKPFSPGEMVARVKARLMRFDQLQQATKAADPAQSLQCGNLRAEPLTHRVFLDDREITMPNREFELLIFLMRNRGMVFSRERLFEEIWGMDAIGDTATVAVHINRLREKIEMDTGNPYFIETIRGAGYRFRAQ